jgi:hypothetical protein
VAGKRLTPAQKLEIIALRGADPKRWTYQALGEHFGCDKETAWRAFHRQPSTIRPGVKDPEVVPPPKLWAELTPENRRLLEDGNFGEWRQKFFRRSAPAFQEEMAQAIVSDEDLVVLVPPGYGKSTLVTHDSLIWDMIRFRVRAKFYACLIVSEAEDLGKGFLRRLTRTLERNKALADAYGAFRPEEKETWKQSAIVVWWTPTDSDDGSAEEKEPTFMVAGRGTQIYGWRLKRIVADDLIGKKESLSPEKTVAIAEWVHEELESRLEPGTNIVYVGTRFSSHELYGHLIDKRDDRNQPLYRIVLYRAHDDSKCSGIACDCTGPCVHHPSYPEGCTLWPERWPYNTLRRTRARLGTARFDFVYNQLETASGDVLCQKEWVDACKDLKRSQWDLPAEGRVPGRIICTVDPSAENWTVFQAWAYVPQWEAQVDKACHFLLAQHRGRVTGPQIVARMKDWTLRLRALGTDPVWVVEVNAFQKWLIQFNDFRQMRFEVGGLTVIPHSTSRNKLDNTFGVYALGPMFEFGKVSIPWGTRQEWDAFAPFVRELVTYPASETSDCVMAAWFYIHHVKRLGHQGSDQAFLEMPDIPPYLRSRQRQVPMFA